MRQQLLSDVERVEEPRPRRRFGPLRGGDDDFLPCFAPGVLVFALLIFQSTVKAVGPNEYGILRNYISGALETQVVRGGIYLTGPFKSFVTFPATQVTLEFSAEPGADHAAVQTRTGADPKDPDSGGQPISISCALQYSFVPETLTDVYLAFGSYEAAQQRYILLAGNMVGNIAQEFTPQDFWTRRDTIAARMLRQINETVWRQGKAIVVRYEIMKVDFAQSFEDSITQVQVAEQAKVVNEYEQQVQEVVQSIEVMRSENLAMIANISAGAAATSKEICARAQRDAFNLKQGMKAQKYSELQRSLEFNQQQLAEYFKIKSIQDQGGGGKVVVGIPSIGLPDTPKGPPRRAQALDSEGTVGERPVFEL